MGKRFLEGLVFGSGFAIAFFVIAWIGIGLLVPMHFSGPREGSVAFNDPGTPLPASGLSEEAGPQFHELPVEEQIKKASVIALARYEPTPDGKMKAVFKEFLKKDPDTTFHYSIGDEYPSASFYPNGKENHGDGLVVFFVGSPAQMRLSMTYSGDRIRSLGDIPLKLFREKCETNA